MTDDDYRELDELLAQKGWKYDAGMEQFEPAAGGERIPWEGVIAAIPHLSLNDLMAYEERKQAEYAQARAARQ